MNLLGRIGSASTTIFFSFILAALSLVLLGTQAPQVLDKILDFAGVLESWLSDILPTQYGVWIQFLVDDSQLTFLMFTIVARIILAIVLTWIGSLFGRSDDDIYDSPRDI